MAPPVKQSEVTKPSTDNASGASELEQLRKENERLKRELAATEAPSTSKEPQQGQFKNSKGQLVDEKYKGTKQYEAGENLFVNGAFIRAGERFSATDTQPGRAWLPLVPKAEPELVVAQPSASPNTQSL